MPVGHCDWSSQAYNTGRGKSDTRLFALPPNHEVIKMKASPKITKVDVVSYRHTIKEVGRDYNTFNMVYEPGGSISRRGNILRIHTDQGITGEYGGEVGGPALAEIKEIAGYLIGKDALARTPC